MCNSIKDAEVKWPPHIPESRRWILRRWANRLRGRYGVPVYLCGSALREDNPDPRDWDVRIMLPDEEFALRFGPVDEWRDEGCTGNWTRTRFRWSDQCVKDTKDFTSWCHMPGDVQIYPESHAAAVYAGQPRLRLDSFPIDQPTPTLAATGGEAEPYDARQLAEAWEIIRRKERDAYNAANSLDVMELDARCSHLGMENAALCERAATAERRLEEAQQVFAVVADELGVDVEAAPTADEPRSAAEHVRREIVGWKDALTASQQEVARLREALAFYGTVENWHTTSRGFAAQYDPAPSPINADFGAKAREALSSPHQSTGQGGGV